MPIAMFFATHFYFCFYHTLSNMALHKVQTALFCFPAATVSCSVLCLWGKIAAILLISHSGQVRSSYVADSTRLLFEICLVLAMSYVTAFMEAFTISGFQCYSVSGPYTI